MKKLIVRGGKSLFGDVQISGSKNAALPILFATLATRGVSKIKRLPNIGDVEVALDLLREFGAIIARDGEVVYIDTRRLYYKTPSDSLVSKIRASTYLLGALLARFGKCPIMNFGGCNFSSRPIDLHILALSCFGANLSQGTLTLESPTPANISFPKASVGATANALIMASATEGKSRISGHAEEPHIMALIDFLRSAGAEITLDGGGITVVGGELHGGAVEIVGDMIEAGSYLAAAVVTDGRISVSGCRISDMRAFLDFLELTGAKIEISDEKITAERGKASIFTSVVAEPYPAFPTDLQPIAASVLASLAGGAIYDKVFPERFGYLAELSQFGVSYKQGIGFAEIFPSALTSASVQMPDLRGGMACLLCALAASGESALTSAETILRGYERLVEKLSAIGADIELS